MVIAAGCRAKIPGRETKVSTVGIENGNGTETKGTEIKDTEIAGEQVTEHIGEKTQVLVTVAAILDKAV